MEAKDTVVEMDDSLTDMEQAIVKVQAEISFKAGRMQGQRDTWDTAIEAAIKGARKEVVEWVDKNWLDSSNLKQWQAKLKEWAV